MPRRPAKACARQGCPKLASDWLCADHESKRKQAYDDGRPSAARRGYDARWRRLRRVVLSRQPVCPCGSAATEVDHIVPKDAGGDDSFDNLQALCKSCHSSKTLREVHGGGGG